MKKSKNTSRLSLCSHFHSKGKICKALFQWEVISAKKPEVEPSSESEVVMPPSESGKSLIQVGVVTAKVKWMLS
jgi:hypothetical protein